MAWIVSHQQLALHPKVLRLSILMGWTLDETLGKLHRFWWWCLDYAPTGLMTNIDSASLGIGLHLSADEGERFIPALVEVHFVCPLASTLEPWRVHDWNHYAGRYLQETRFKRHATKLNEFKLLYSQSCASLDSPQFVPGKSLVPDLTGPNRTGPNQNKERKENIPHEQSSSGVDTWAAYAAAYELTYHTPPVRNATVNSQLKLLVKKLGSEAAPQVAAFYLTHKDKFYVMKRHPVNLLLKDAEGLHTQMITGAKATALEAKGLEEEQGSKEQTKRLIKNGHGTHQTINVTPKPKALPKPQPNREPMRMEDDNDGPTRTT
jgi:hypothetical protein